MELKQQLRLTQQLVMTPQLQQAIRLLQLSRLELIDEVRKELDGNPILSAEEDPDPKGRASDDTARAAGAPAGAGVVERGERVENNYSADEPHKVEAEKATREVDWEKFLENRTQQQAPSLGPRSSDDLPPFEQNLTKPSSLADHMRWQLQMSDFTEEERRFAELVIGNLDEKGYLDLEGVERPDGTRTPDLTIEDLAEEAGLHPEDAPLVLELIQNFDPVGVAARSLQECLLVQAKAFGYDPVELTILEKHMANLEKHNYQAIARDMKISLEDTYEAAKEIQKLESRPARNFVDHSDRSIGITPDVYVIKDGDNFVVADNDRGVQKLHINQALTQRLLKDPAAQEFVGEKLRNAQWLIRAIEQRRKTIVKVSESIIDKQREFFEKGVAFLKPMILRDVAEAVGMHESTISRVTTNKYMHTPKGLFELKYFFNSSIRRVADEDIASESVKQAIKQIIENENKQSPLSDQAIVQILEQTNGIKIARRTVAKYREMLCILASSKRKKLF
ncbi:MAG TPA: RNA polymerase factor sigma-54 [Polyangiaceae bacterium]|nr:RNA polymerase factor sigma-54 [Polyangiaceae bacterium]